MPDWSYQTFLRPAFFLLRPAQARNLTLSLIGGLSRILLGPNLIELLGNMRPAMELSTKAGGLDVMSPVGLGAGLDTGGIALAALGQFGFGFLESGPVTERPILSEDPIERDAVSETILYPASPANEGLAALLERIRARPRPTLPTGFRLAHQPNISSSDAAQERARMVQALAEYASFFTLETAGDLDWTKKERQAHLVAVANAIDKHSPDAVLWISVTPDTPHEEVDAWIAPALDHSAEGVIVSGGVRRPNHQRAVGSPAREASVSMVRHIHGKWGDRVCIIGSGGVLEPADAVRLFEAGASLVQVHSGLVFSGPGLPKRINETMLARSSVSMGASSRNPKQSPFAQSWFWMLLLGLGMIFSGTIAAIIAVTRVVLPYDEAFVGLGPSGIRRINPHLLHFMTHDRVTLAGTMISIGLLYSFLAYYGIRRSAHWAWKAVCISASIGFASFFLFLGFGYFDPLHALISAFLFIIFLLGLRARPTGVGPVVDDLYNDLAWRRSLWGQLLFIMIGAGLILAGISISAIGVTRVFVPTDLMFLHTTPEAITSANSRLLPLIAHDRAGFGGALVSDGLAVLLTSLWGFRRGARWVWIALLLAGLPGFIAALGVHVAIGYMTLVHLLPVYVSSLFFLIGLILSWGYLFSKERVPRLDHSSADHST
jgi:dihydroorotate dehydrogenase